MELKSKNPGRSRGVHLYRLESGDLLGLWALGALADFELDLLVLLEGAEACLLYTSDAADE